MSATCGHSFCGECIFDIYERINNRLDCPLCRRPVTTLFRNFPDGIDDHNSEKIIVGIIDYNRAFDDNRSWWRRIREFPYVWRMVRRGVFNPRFLVFFIRSAFFLRWAFIMVVYLIVPLDIIPERVFGIAGFIDDLFLSLFGLIFMVSIAAVAYMRMREA